MVSALSRTTSLMVLLVVGAAAEGYSNPDGSEYEHQSAFEDNLRRYYHSSNPDYKVYSQPDLDHGLPLIVWWTFQLFPDFQRMPPNYVVQCGDVSCHSTNDRSLASHPNARGFLFYGTDIDPMDLPLPRNPRHEWGLYHEESPLNKYILSHQQFIELFNHTATFRFESDFPLTTQNIYHDQFLTERESVPLDVKNKARKKDKLAPLLYVQSHCGIPSDRDRYVQELMKYIDVDSYGKCLHNKDFPKDLDDYRMMEQRPFLEFISRYKFHLAFENAICKDYMTEKLMRALHVGSIPVYRGSSSVRSWMPSNKSVIVADDFSSPKELAAFIKNIDEDDTEYASYVNYKKTGIENEFLLAHLKNRGWENYSVMSYTDGFETLRGFECMVCKRIHEREANEKNHERNASVPLMPPRMANSSHMGCPQPRPSLEMAGKDFPTKDK